MLTLNLHLDNPGAFFAACGIAEFLHRQQEGVLLSFHEGHAKVHGASLEDLRAMVDSLFSQPITGGEKLYDPIRFGEFTVGWYAEGKIAGPLYLPYRNEIVDLRLPAEVKAGWGGRQTPLGVFNKLFPLMPKGKKIDEDFLRATGKTQAKFGLDPNSAWNSLGMGFSPNNHAALKQVRVSAAVEIFGFLGLQTFRPTSDGHNLHYFSWSEPIPIPVARLAVGNRFPFTHQHFIFGIKSRGDYSSFSQATGTNIQKEDNT